MILSEKAAGFVNTYSWIQHILAEIIFITVKQIYNLELWKSPILANVLRYLSNLKLSEHLYSTSQKMFQWSPELNYNVNVETVIEVVSVWP